MALPPRMMALFAVMSSAAAHAAPLEELARHGVSEPVRHLSTLPDGSGLVWVGRTGTRLFDPTSGRSSAAIGPGGRAARVLDLDGDGRLEVLVCGVDGLYHSTHSAQGWTEPERLERTPCQDLLPSEDRVLVVGAATRWLDTDRTLSAPIAVLKDKGRVLGAVRDGQWWVGTAGTRVLAGPDGTQRLDVALGGLAATERGLAWSQTRQAQVVWGEQVLETAAAPEGLIALERDAGSSLAVLHPNLQSIGWFDADGAEQLVDVGFEARVAIAADSDKDGCPDLVVGDGNQVRILRGVCPPPQPITTVPEAGVDPWSVPTTPPPLPPAEPDKRVRRRPERTTKEIPREQGPKLGPFRLPVLAGYTHTGPRPGRFSLRSVRLSTGFTMLRPFLNATSAFPLQTSPNVTFIVETGTWNVRLYTGASSAPLSIGIDTDTGVPYWHLLVGRLGVAWGNDRLRVGVHANLGIIAAGVGIRVVLEPIQFRRVRMGLDLYLDVMAQGLAEGGLLVGWTFPRAGDAPQSERWKDGTPGCRRVTLGLGAGLAVGSTRFSWEYVGTDVNVAVTGGPALVGTCEAGRAKGIRPWLGVSTSPWSTWAGPGDQDLAHLGSLDGGVLFGGPKLAAGLHASAGVLMLGAGARVVWFPWQGEQGARAGFELRGTALWPSAPAAEVMLLGTMAWDPRPVRVAARKERKKDR